MAAHPQSEVEKLQCLSYFYRTHPSAESLPEEKIKRLVSKHADDSSFEQLCAKIAAKYDGADPITLWAEVGGAARVPVSVSTPPL